MEPLLTKRLTISKWALGKPLLLTILLPLMIGAAIRPYAATVATKITSVTKLSALFSTLTTIMCCHLTYGKG